MIGDFGEGSRKQGFILDRSPGCPKDRTRDAKSAEAGSRSSILVLTFFLFALAYVLVPESSYHFA